MTAGPSTAAIPHREPFLLVDEIVERAEARIVCSKTFSGREDFFAGHYPGHPIVPGVLLCEAAMQAGAILLPPPGGSRGPHAGGHADERRAISNGWSGPERRSAWKSNCPSGLPTPSSSRPRSRSMGRWRFASTLPAPRPRPRPIAT